MFSPELLAVSSAEWYASFATSLLHSYADTGPGPLEGEERRREKGDREEGEGMRRGKERKEKRKGKGEREGGEGRGEGREKGMKGVEIV